MIGRMKRTPLHDRHALLGAHLEPFGGWEMPIRYTGILAEHAHTRRLASVFDTSHMGEIALRGPGAAADLNHLLTRTVDGQPVGSCRYGYLLNDSGGVLDDLTCYRLGGDHFLLVINAGHAERNTAWIRAHAGAATEVEDRSAGTGKLDVQGPAARRLLEEALGIAVPDLKFFRCAQVPWGDTTLLVSRSGYTGEHGYELYLPAERTADCWDALLGPGQIRPAGLGARDTLRLEMGYPLYGHELTEDRTPVAAARGRFIDLQPEHAFIGRDAVDRDLAEGCPRYLCGLRLAGRRAARAGDAVMAGDAVVGKVTSGSMAPSLGVAVAMAYVDTALAEPGTPLAVAVRGGVLEAVTVTPPFYTPGR